MNTPRVMRTCLIPVFAALLASAPARGQWLRLASPNFELYTNAREITGRRVLVEFEQIRQVFHGMGGAAETTPLPVTVYLLRSAAYRLYQPSAVTRGFYRGGPEGDYILIDASAPELTRIANHEYVHVVLDHTSVRLPQWLEEGVAEFYSTLRSRGNKLEMGRPIRNHVSTLTRQPWMSAEELAAVDHDSPVYSESNRVGIFYAQSWALVHMLNMDPQYRDKIPRYAELLTNAKPPGEAFEEAFGRPLDRAIADLRSYVRRGAWPVREADWEPLEEPAIEAQTLNEIDAAMVELRLQQKMGKWELSERSLEKLAHQRGNTPRIVTARAMLAMSRRDYAGARAQFEKAIELGSEDASTYFEYAMLLRDTGADPKLVRDNLEKTVALNPRFAEAHFLLGVMAANEGRHGDAIGPLQWAVDILPRQSYFWHALALSYYRTGRVKDARIAARRALEAARTPEETEMARAALELTLTRKCPAAPPRRAAVSTPSGWFNRQGNSVVTGTLVRIDCQGAEAVLQVRAGEQTLALGVKDPSKVVLKNLTTISFEFACGVELSRPVEVEYVAATDDGGGAAGEVTAITFQ